MSQLDIINAKRALSYRLNEWGITNGDPIKLADGFIDDLVRLGWQMSPDRELRIYPPRADEECRKHRGQHKPPFCGICRNEKRTPDDPQPSPDLTTPPNIAARLSRGIGPNKQEESND